MKRTSIVGAETTPAPADAVFVESYTIREAHAFAYPGEGGVATQILIELRTPGTFATQPQSCNIDIRMRGGPSKESRNFDCYAGDLDALVAALQEAIRVAREEGVIAGDGQAQP